MAVVKSYISYSVYIMLDAEHSNTAMTMFGTAAVIYPISFYFLKTGKVWESLYIQLLLHAISCVGSVYLYTGAIPRANSLLM